MENEAQTPATPDAMKNAETSAANMVDAWVSAFKNFPTQGNLDGVIERLQKYQYAWMNGRKRPE